MPKYAHTEDERRILGCIGKMPGGATVSIARHARLVGFDGGRPQPITMDEVADYLESIVSLHTRLFAEASEAVRRLFGLK